MNVNKQRFIFSFSFPGSNSGEADNQSEWTDVQKKIIPWKNHVPDFDLELVFQDRAAKLGKSISRLIVVASLIDKPTNLGGKMAVFQGACLRSFDPENLYSTQCHLGPPVHIPPSPGASEECPGPGGLGPGLAAASLLVPCRAVPDLWGVRGRGAGHGQPSVCQRQAVSAPQCFSRTVASFSGGGWKVHDY